MYSSNHVPYHDHMLNYLNRVTVIGVFVFVILFGLRCCCIRFVRLHGDLMDEVM